MGEINLKTLSSACLCITLHFIPDYRLKREEAVNRVKDEVLTYRKNLGDNAIITKEVMMEDGSIILCVRKKVKEYPIGSYFETL